MKLLIPLTFLLLLSLPLSGSLSPTTSDMPRDWYTLPEELPPESEELSSATAARQRFVQSLDEILSANTDALEQFSQAEPTPTPTPSPSKWGLRSISLGLGISAGGSFGPVVLSGSPAVSVRWAKRTPKPPAKSLAESPSPSARPSLVFSERESDAAINDELEPFIQTLIHQGVVQNIPLLREQLQKQARLFVARATALSMVSPSRWTISSYGLSLGIQVSGMVQPGVLVGGGVGVSFEWFKNSKRTSHNVALSPDSERLKRFVEDLAADLETIAETKFQDTNFVPDEIELGIGVSASGHFGVVRAGVHAGESVSFSYEEERPSRRETATRASQPLRFLIDNPSEAQMQFAKAHHIATERAPGSAPSRTAFIIERVLFRKGLKHAVKLEHLVAERATKSTGNHWYVRNIEASFQLSISGSLGFITLSSYADASIALRSKTDPQRAKIGVKL